MEFRRKTCASFAYRHGHGRWHWLGREERDESDGLRNATAGSVLRDRARRTVYVDAPALHDVVRRALCQAQLVGVRLDPCQGYLDALLEHVSQLAGQLDAAAARHVGYLDEQDAPLAARAVGHKTSYNARPARLLCDFLFELVDPEDLSQVLNRDLWRVPLKLTGVLGVRVLNSLCSA